ncbi:NAD(+)/NADH kinase [Paenarthrobacter sp. Z7-10]|uniref:diacylglycerol/lipid kinase family protein n=1 Tax=Paenarthrobacter sp. Z7-10 TaxID=2787635 RepID=UPI0022A930FF|nr:diacylglycerol kinase family protein [Paenarthrobacter sp. Z7-10]MCZ2402184.1 NAD(+)/NADH kinase [Paenarthrobacter sp. Z7-10]
MTESDPTSAGAPARRAAVVVNPAKSLDLDLREAVQEICRDEGWTDPLWLETSVEDPGAGQARQALEEGVDVVLAAGGDGTVRCVAGVLAGTNTALGLIPLGTGNLLARNLGINISDPALAAWQALTGTTRRIDVVRAVVDDAAEEQIFLVMAGLGYDAAIMADTNDGLKDRVGWLAYVDAGIRNLPGKPVRAKISIDGARPVSRRLRSLMGGNCGRLQGGIEMFPGAQPDDGVLDLMTLAPSGTFGWFAVLAGLFTRGRTKDPAVEYFQGKSVQVATDVPQEIQLDGDHIGQGSRLTMTVDPGALLVTSSNESRPKPVTFPAGRPTS